MGIKRRPTADLAAIEAFGDAAESPAVTPAQVRRDEPSGEGWPDDLARTLLIRYRDPELPALLAEVARLDGRSQQMTAQRILRQGLQAALKELGG